MRGARRGGWLVAALGLLVILSPGLDEGVTAGAFQGAVHGIAEDGRGRSVAGAEVGLARLSETLEWPPTLLPLDEALVLTTRSGEDGSYRFAGLPPGWYVVTGRTSERVSRSGGEAFLSDEYGVRECRRHVRLEPAVRTAGTVIGTDGRPVMGARVVSGRGGSNYGQMLFEELGARMLPVTTNALGRFVHDHAERMLEVRAEGFAKAVFEVAPGSQNNVFELPVGGTVTGRILRGGKPVAGVKVTAWRKEGSPTEAVSDAEGRYALEHLEPATEYAIEARGEGLAGTTLPVVTLNDGELREGVDIEAGNDGVVTGRVYAEETGEPIAGARVAVAAGPFGWNWTELRTGADGRYAVGPLAPGTYAVWCNIPASVVRAVDERTRHGEAEIVAGEPTAPVDFVFKRGARLSGRILDSGGRPVAGARVEANNRYGQEQGDPLGSGVGVSGADGRYKLSGLVPGCNGSVTVRAKGYYAVRKGFEAKELGRDDFNLLVEKGATISGVVKDRRGRPVAWAQIEPEVVEGSQGTPVQEGLAPASYSFPYTPGTLTDAEGRFELRDLWPGAYRFSVQCAEPSLTLLRESVGRAVVAGPGEALTDVEVVVPAVEEEAIAGRVADEAGEPLADVQVWIEARYPDPPVARVWTDESGRYLMGGLGAEARDLTFEKEGYALAHVKGVTPGAIADAVMGKHGGIRGRVYDVITRQPIRDGQAKVLRVWTVNGEEGGQGENVDLGRARRDGEFLIQKVAPGLAFLEVTAPGHATRESEGIVVKSGETTEGVQVYVGPEQ